MTALWTAPDGKSVFAVVRNAASQIADTRWTVLRRFAISCLSVALALPAVARTRPHYGGTLRVEIEGDPWQRPGGLARRLVFDGLTAHRTRTAPCSPPWLSSGNRRTTIIAGSSGCGPACTFTMARR